MRRTLVLALLILTAVLRPNLAAPGPSARNSCIGPLVLLPTDGFNWGGDSGDRRFPLATEAGLTANDVPKLKLKWAFGFRGDSIASSQAAVFGGRLFVGSEAGTVYSLDAKSGCGYWSYEGVSAVRAAITIGPLSGHGYAAYAGDQQANVYALDASTGKLIWQVRVDEHRYARITGAPRLYKGVLYVPVASGEEWARADPQYECCTFRGSVVGLDAQTGKQIWKTFTIPDAPKRTLTNRMGTQLWGLSGAPVWGSPTLDTERAALYVATGNDFSDRFSSSSDAVLALDLATGKILWSRQLTDDDIFTGKCSQTNRALCPGGPGPDYDFASSPILCNLPKGKRAIIAGQKSGLIHALDPDQEGEVIWQEKIGKGGVLGGIQWGLAADDANIYAPLSDLVLRVTDGSTSLDHATFQPSPLLGGGMFALRLKDGKKIWATPAPRVCRQAGCSPAQTAGPTLIPGVVFSCALDGHLRAYDTADGSIVWDYDTAHDYPTVNGAPAKGGGIDGAGPVVAGRMLFVSSGYSRYSGMPGNVLLAFGIE